MITKRKKNSRQRGSKTHGWGAMKKHRGSGHKGGVGNAGSGKRGDCKKPMYLKNKRLFGRNGFKRANKVIIHVTNIAYLEQKLDKLKNNKMIIEENGFLIVDLKNLGFEKLLGAGKTKNKFKITVKEASNSAVSKIEKAGGMVILPESQKPAE